MSKRGLQWSEENHRAWKIRKASRKTGTAISLPIVGECNAQDRPRPALKLTQTEIPEAAVLSSVLKALDLHPRVGWVARMNSGVVMVGEGARKRPFRAGFVGCSDIVGQLVDGRLLAIECKRVGKQPTPAQQEFLERVIRFGGVAFVARNVDDVMRGLA